MYQSLFYFILYYVKYIILLFLRRLFSNEIQKRGGSREEDRWGGTRRSKWRGNCNKDILIEKNLFYIKLKTKQFLREAD